MWQRQAFESLPLPHCWCKISIDTITEWRSQGISRLQYTAAISPAALEAKHYIEWTLWASDSAPCNTACSGRDEFSLTRKLSRQRDTISSGWKLLHHVYESESITTNKTSQYLHKILHITRRQGKYDSDWTTNPTQPLAKFVMPTLFSLDADCAIKY